MAGIRLGPYRAYGSRPSRLPGRPGCSYHRRPMVGGVIDGKYRLLRLLGEGGMGAVYEAEPTDPAPGATLPARVALKLMMPELLGRKDSTHLARFHREARTASAIDTPHIIRVFDFGTDPATSAPFMVMELLLGQDLDHLLKDVGMLKPDTAMRIAAQVCTGLAKAHEARVIHRDIKPANLFLAQRDDGSLIVKILDFGIAKIKPDVGAQTSGLTRSGSLLGSPRYMSPEQAKGLKSIDYRTDIWSLGVVLYRILSGRLPHQEAQSLGDLIIAICTSPPRLVQDVAPWVSPEVAKVVHRALCLDPDDRFASATAMLDTIRPLLPQGLDLHERDLLAPGDETRSVVAPRSRSVRRFTRPASEVVTAETPGAAAGTATFLAARATTVADGQAQPVSTAEGPAPPLPPEGAPSRPEEARGLPSESARSEPAPSPPPRRSWGLVAGGAMVAAVLASAGLYSALASSAVGPGSGEAASPPAPERRRVKLAISPLDASVEVDGVGVSVEDGYAVIEATPGTTHRVRLFKGKNERIWEVTVTPSGASPGAMSLEPDGR
jgi:eukaryotic-like serine/threonine-protein kinase